MKLPQLRVRISHHVGRVPPAGCSHFVILSSIDLGSRIKVGNVILLRSAPGRSCEMMCESTALEELACQVTGLLDRCERRFAALSTEAHTIALLSVHDHFFFSIRAFGPWIF